ncbi:cuticle protein 10.9-like [Parasteatoda tepidariorum]|uniref:cuticle protein 10.9-like n=1 Tax=Parasteatoda tepidariorum TaxID=114398 RepID=UPI001C7286FC|nr:cuticle protein 10.9-like [Parasteatoda tepidariorum]
MTFSKAILVALFALTTISCILAQSVVQPVLLGQPVAQIPKPFRFGYEFGDGLGMSQYRHESSDENGFVTGSYGYQDPYGVYRKVQYNAGVDGFRANILSNEPGLTSHVPADAPYSVLPPPPAAVARSFRRVPVFTAIRK